MATLVPAKLPAGGTRFAQESCEFLLTFKKLKRSTFLSNSIRWFFSSALRLKKILNISWGTLCSTVSLKKDKYCDSFTVPRRSLSRMHESKAGIRRSLEAGVSRTARLVPNIAKISGLFLGIEIGIICSFVDRTTRESVHSFPSQHMSILEASVTSASHIHTMLHYHLHVPANHCRRRGRLRGVLGRLSRESRKQLQVYARSFRE